MRGRHKFVRDEFLEEKHNLINISKRRHAHLLGMLASFETTGSKFDTLNIVIPYAGGGNLYDFLRLERLDRWEQCGYPRPDPALVGCLTDWRFSVYFQIIGVVDALAELHRDSAGKFMIHCDIKPANILIQKGVFKLADFGLSRLRNSDETSKTLWYCGTPLYSPPEREKVMGRGRDVWAMGCVLLEVALMIRFCFQDESGYFDPNATNIIDDFQKQREAWALDQTGERTSIYHKTMPSVHEELERFQCMRPGLRRMIVVDGLIPAINKMLEEDQTQRATAYDMAQSLKRHYEEMMMVPSLQRDIECRDNPGGPPADWSVSARPATARQSVQSTPPDGMGHTIRQRAVWGNRHNSFVSAQLNSTSESDGLTGTFQDIEIGGKRRSSAFDEQDSNKRHRGI